ncbi:hypothetical protein DB32_000844 [Sandaracinus amylolyticus]|uniref:Uncharacterized protein n=1 Tax=Sandaracinus amylolyticus TaxID=927083 RepID=A0A0F6YFH7_9BACT|nr:hypothetical protein DB32_000844 [Sandaracinus amylolyticus]
MRECPGVGARGAALRARREKDREAASWGVGDDGGRFWNRTLGVGDPGGRF